MQYNTNVKKNDKNMRICCDDKKQIKNIWHLSNYVTFARGSVMYGTSSDDSDIDIGIIVPDDTEFVDLDGVFDNEKCDTRLHPSIPVCVLGKGKFNKALFIDCQFVRESDFIDMIKEHTPFAIEALATRATGIDKYYKYFTLDKWQLRKSFGSVANNSWSKAHKKMTVEKDFDMKCGVKSLFHSIRLQIFACDIAKNVLSFKLDCCKDLWDEIKEDWSNGFTWEDFKTKYKPIYNKAHSDMVELCPKPESEYKSAKR